MATGIYHKHNVLKFRIMLACFDADRPLTCRELADELGVPPTNISVVMNRYRAKRCGYFQRLRPVVGKSFRYKLTKKGLGYLVRYAYRFYDGFELSLSTPVVKAMPKRARVLAERQVEFARRQAEFEITGIEQPQKSKPTLKEILDIKPEDLVGYMGITKQGALEMGITGIDILIGS